MKLLAIFLLISVQVSASNAFAYSFTIDTSKAKSSTSCDYKKYYHPNGKVKEEGCLINGKKDGVWKIYLENGDIEFEWMYLKGLKNGAYKHYDKGKINATGEYKNGCLHGLLKIYNEQGELTSEQWWKGNFATGVSTMLKEKNYDKNAKPDNTIETIDGKRYIWRNGKKLPLIENK